MRLEHVIAVAVATVLVTAFGCTSSTTGTAPPGDDDAGTDGGSSGQGDPDAAAATADALCDYLGRCVPSGIAGAYGDVATCKQRQEARMRQIQAAPGAAYTKAQSDACLAKIAALSCDAFDATVVPSECYPKGTLPNGSKCAESAQCASGGCFHASPDTDQCGVCQDDVGEGGDCSSALCATNLACIGTTCTRKRQLGEACNSVTTPCITALDCVQGRCVNMLGANAACGGADQALCNTLVSLLCKATAPPAPNGTCQALGTSNVGGSCGIDKTNATLTVCTKSDCSVDINVNAGLGTCTAFLADGAKCEVGAPVGCAPPASCTTKKCVLARDPSLCQ